MEGIEQWKGIEYYNNYEVSNLGQVRNKNTEIILKPSCKGGYLVVGLCANGICKTFSIHRSIDL